MKTITEQTLEIATDARNSIIGSNTGWGRSYLYRPANITLDNTGCI